IVSANCDRGYFGRLCPLEKLSLRIVPDDPQDLLLLRTARAATAIARTGSLQRRAGQRPNFAVNLESVRLLKSAHSLLSARPELSVDTVWVESQIAQSLLQGLNLRA